MDMAAAVPSVRAPAETPEEAAEVVPEGPEGQNSGGQVMPEVPPQESPAVDLPAADTPIAAAAEPSPVVPAMSPPLPSPASTPALIPEAEKTEDQIFYVKRIDRSLPFFKMPQDLAMGQYYFVFQVEGEKDILYQTEKAFYFLGDAEFAINDIAAYPPGFSESHTVPPGTIIMLDVQVLADERLDPYVIWYNGRKRITEGSLSAGTSRIMWKIPEQSGFQTIQAEVLPFPPFKQDRVLNELPRGKVKEVSVAISSKGEGLGYYSKISGKERQNSLIHWYQFLGDLRDSLVSSTDRGTLKASQAPGWEPAGGIYGITIGPNDVYELPSMRFNVSEEATGRGQLFFRFKPLNDGPILRAFFKEIGKSTSGVELKVSYKKASSLLIMSLEDEKAQEQSSVKVPEKEDYVNAIVSFNLRGKSFGVSLKIEGSGGASEEKVLFPSRTLSGEGLIQLGTIPVQGGQGSRSPVIILDELAVHYVVEPDPPPPAEIVEDQSENEVKTDKTVNENAPNNKDTLTTAEVAGEEKLL